MTDGFFFFKMLLLEPTFSKSSALKTELMFLIWSVFHSTNRKMRPK